VDKKLKILVVYQGRFGFHVVSYFLCKYASRKHDITYLGLILDPSGVSLNLPNVKVHEYICQTGIKGRRELFSILKKKIDKENYDIIFTSCIAGISILKNFLKNKKVIIDIRSGYLFRNRLKCFLLNRMRCFEARQFGRNITINSELLAKYLGFRTGEVVELPLGAEPIKNSLRKYNKLRLIYIGGYEKRNIDLTIIGLKLYIDQFKKHNIESYDLVAYGPSAAAEDKIRKVISENNLNSIVKMHGYVPRDRIKKYLKSANIGVSFVPITPYYDFQPVTKTYEFLVAGLPVIATCTTQNKRLINETNGVLICDNAESFCQGLKEISSRSNKYNSLKIQKESLKHSWKSLILENYIPYIEKVANEK